MNIRKHQELMDFWEYSHNFDSEDGAFSIDEDITFEASQQELQIELEHFNEMDLEQELHPIKDDNFQPKDEHPNKTMLKKGASCHCFKATGGRCPHCFGF